MKQLGLDSVKVINGLPSVIGYAPETVQSKVAHLTALGLGAIKIIAGFPAVLNLAALSVQDKVRFMSSTAKILKWHGSIKDLIEYYPALLCFNIQKMQILRNIAATAVGVDRHDMSLSHIRSALIIPLEAYIASYNEESAGDALAKALTIKHRRLTKAERREAALLAIKVDAVPKDIAKAYLEYAPLKANEIVLGA